MPTPTGDMIALVAAIASNGVIGRDGQLPWRLPADLKFFRDLTRDHVVVMGRKTFDSIGRPLDRRLNIVLTRDRSWQHEGVLVAHTLEDAMLLGPSGKTRFVIGGANVYREAMRLVDVAYITRVHAEFPGDTRLDLDLTNWHRTLLSQHPIDERNNCCMTMERYDRDVPHEAYGQSPSRR